MRRASLGVAAVTLSLVAVFTTGRPPTPSAGIVHHADAASPTTTVPEASTTVPETTTVPEPVTLPEPVTTLYVPPTTQPVPTTRSVPVQTTVAAPVSTGSVHDRIEGCESYGDPNAPPNYLAENPSSSASGAAQYLDSTWNWYGGYRRARDAPPSIQEERFTADLLVGTGPWSSSRACWA
jgi:hypothetical protein